MSRPNFQPKTPVRSLPYPREKTITGADINDLLAGVQFLYDAYGWENYIDGTYTEANKRSLTGGQEYVLTIDGATSDVSQAPTVEGHTAFWSGNKLRSYNVGDAFTVRVGFEASVTANDAYLGFEVRIGAAVIYRDIFLFPKGANVPHGYSESIKLYSLAAYVTNGAEIVLLPSANTLFWDARIFIEKTYNGR